MFGRVLRLWLVCLFVGVVIVLSEGMLAPEKVKDGPEVRDRGKIATGVAGLCFAATGGLALIMNSPGADREAVLPFLAGAAAIGVVLGVMGWVWISRDLSGSGS